MQSWQASPLAPERVAFLTGFPRSGTTLLEQMLKAHPGLVSLEEQDVMGSEIFPKLNGDARTTPVIEILRSLSTDQLCSHREDYLRCVRQLLGEPLGSRWQLDRNPALTLMIPVLRRLFPEARLIFALRDPRDVILSCFLRYLPLNPVSACFLTLDRVIDRYRLDIEAWIKYRELLGEGWLESVTKYLSRGPNPRSNGC